MIHYVLSVDPGKASGVSLFSRERDQDPVLIWSKELQQEEVAEVFRGALWAPEKRHHIDVVCERFTINAQTVKNSQAP